MAVAALAHRITMQARAVAARDRRALRRRRRAGVDGRAADRPAVVTVAAAHRGVAPDARPPAGARRRRRAALVLAVVGPAVRPARARRRRSSAPRRVGLAPPAAAQPAVDVALDDTTLFEGQWTAARVTVGGEPERRSRPATGDVVTVVAATVDVDAARPAVGHASSSRAGGDVDVAVAVRARALGPPRGRPRTGRVHVAARRVPQPRSPGG